MKRNIGKTDKIIRIVAGIAAIGAGYYCKSWWGAIGLVLLLTAAINWCPIYVPLKISTHKK